MKYRGFSPREQDLSVLRVLSERASDGYLVMQLAGLTSEELTDVVLRLERVNLITLRGARHAERIGETFFAVPPHCKGQVARLLTTAA